MEDEELRKIIPDVYHDYLDLFHEREGTQTLPLHREYDHRIEVFPDAKLRVAKLYQLTEQEKEYIHEYLEKERSCGQIRPSHSYYGSPTFFVKKKDGRLRMVVDYRHLNSMTVKDVYPLPLISQVFSELRDAKYFTKLDLVGAYQLLRMKEGHEPLTAFQTPFGMFESLVMRDGLCNAPASFQHFLNDIFQDMLGRGVVVYIDDIMIYGKTLEELREKTRRVFDVIREHNLYLKAPKCEFEKQEINFLGFRITRKGIHTDPSKVAALKDYPSPTNVREVRKALGFLSYYRRFVKDFSILAKPLTSLLKKDAPFKWTEECEKAFCSLTKRLITAPVLIPFSPDYPIILETDASAFGWGIVISQQLPDCKYRQPIVFDSGRFSPAEINYSVADCEFLAIIMAIRKYRYLLEGGHHPVQIYTDHRNLIYFTKAQQLSPRQHRWVTELSRINYELHYQPGKTVIVPDILSRRPDYHPGKGATHDLDHNPELMSQALQSFTEPDRPLLPLAMSSQLRATAVRNFFVNDQNILDGLRLDETANDLHEQMLQMKCYDCDHPTCKTTNYAQETRRLIAKDPRILASMRLSWSPQGFILVNDRVYVPNHEQARLAVMRIRHDSLLAGHPGIQGTIKLVQRDYYWPGLTTDVANYVASCDTCLRTKPLNRKPYSQLHSMPVPELPFEHITMDFIEQLPPSNEFDAILVIVCRLTKFAIFIPTTTKLDTMGLVKLFLIHFVAYFGLPKTIVSDRGNKFVAKFWGTLTEYLKIVLLLSTGYHPQTDGQTERVNHILEQYIRRTTDYLQTDWSDYLPMAAFAYNNATHSATTMSPYYAVYGFNPRWTQARDEEVTGCIPAAKTLAKDLSKVHEYCASMIKRAQERYARFHNKLFTKPPQFKKGEKVLLDLKNIKTKRPTRKFDDKRWGPIEIEKVVGHDAYKLKLPKTARIHNVFTCPC